MSTPMPTSELSEGISSITQAVVPRRAATVRDLLPAHRLPVIAKTPILVAMGGYFAHADFRRPELWLTLILSALLWTALYALNEMTDVMEEQGLFVPAATQKILYVLPLLICVASASLSVPLCAYLAAMTLGQYVYCVPAVRLKRYWFTILILSGAINPLLRLQCGAIWGTQTLPILASLVFVLLHLGATFRARTLQRERDSRLSYTVAPDFSDWLGPLCSAAGLIGALILCGQGILPPVFAGFVLVAGGFALYAWSGRVDSMAHLRRGWIAFALMSLVALLILTLTRR
jgi:hypothetical protein